MLAQASGFVSTDVDMIYFAPSTLPAGQYYRKMGPQEVRKEEAISSLLFGPLGWGRSPLIIIVSSSVACLASKVSWRCVHCSQVSCG